MRKSEILTPNSPDFYLQSQYTERQYKFFPTILRGSEGVRKVISLAKEDPTYGLGLDWEFDPRNNQPSIIGVSYVGPRFAPVCASHLHDITLIRDIYDSGLPIVAYAGTDADKRVAENVLGFENDLARWEDPLIRHYLINSDYCSAPGKDLEDENDGYALGLLNLWSAASQYTLLPNWKYCRGEHPTQCYGPCPAADVFGYCAVDAYAGHLVNQSTKEEMRQKHIPEKLYEELKSLTVYCGEMTRKGIKVDRELIKNLEKDFYERKQLLFSHEIRKKKRYFGKWSAPNTDGEIIFLPNEFNPNSPKDAYKYFASIGIELRGRGGKPSTNKGDVIKALNKEIKKKGLEFDSKLLAVVDSEGNDCVESLPHELRLLANLCLYKCSGKGLKSWFDESYIDVYDYIHSRFIVTGASTGRLSSANPNFQNIPRVGFGANVRRVLIPSSPSLSWIKADVGGLEYRIIFWYAGERHAPDTIFEDIVNSSEGKLVNAAKVRNFTPRDVAKSLVHAGNYFEGLKVIKDDDLRKERIAREIECGALVVYRDWQYGGGYVACTGANLAERVFGSRSLADRAAALELQDCYFRQYPFIREFQKEISRDIERKGYVKGINGHQMDLYNSPEDNLKLALAFLGQGGGAVYVREAMLRYAQLGEIMNLQVHDELATQKPKEWSDEECVKFMSVMSEESEYFTGLRCPIKVSRGECYKEGILSDELHEIGKTYV